MALSLSFAEDTVVFAVVLFCYYHILQRCDGDFFFAVNHVMDVDILSVGFKDVLHLCFRFHHVDVNVVVDDGLPEWERAQIVGVDVIDCLMKTA